MNGAHLLFYIGSGLAIWAVFRIETWRARREEVSDDV